MRAYQQIFLVAALSCAMTVLTDQVHYRGWLNLLWMVAAPIVVAIAANKDIGWRGLMTCPLVIISWVAASLTGVLVIGY